MRLEWIEAAAAVALIVKVPPPNQRSVGTEWVWFTDYAYMTALWSVHVESDCEVEVGIGVKMGSRKLGGSVRVRRYAHIRTFLAGSMHVRAVSGRAPCLVQVDKGHVDALGLYSEPSVLRGAVRDGRIVYDKLVK